MKSLPKLSRYSHTHTLVNSRAPGMVWLSMLTGVMRVLQRLVQGSDDCQDNWSMSELMHAVVLLAHFHSLASFVYGCGVTSETDHPDGHVYTASSTDEPSTAVSNDELSQPINGHTAVTADV